MTDSAHTIDPAASYRRPGRPGITPAEFDRAALECLKKGERPSIERIMEMIGGSHSTLGPLMNAWWAQLFSRAHMLGTAFQKLPGSLPQLAEAFFLCALDEAYRVAQERTGTVRSAIDGRADDLDARAYALRLLEDTLRERIAKRDQDVEELRLALREEKQLTRRLITKNDGYEVRIRELETQLSSAKTAFLKGSRGKVANAVKRKRATVHAKSGPRRKQPKAKTRGTRR